MNKIALPPSLPSTSQEPPPNVIEPPVDWERAFVALVAVTCTGFVSSHDVAAWVEFVREKAGDKPAKVMIEVFNKTRSSMMHNFMG